MPDIQIPKFSFKHGREDSHYRVWAGDLFVGTVYPEWGPWRPRDGWGPATGEQVRDQTGWIASAFHFKPDGTDQNIHQHYPKRLQATEELWKLRVQYGWNDCPCGKGGWIPGHEIRIHTCTLLPQDTISNFRAKV